MIRRAAMVALTLVGVATYWWLGNAPSATLGPEWMEFTVADAFRHPAAVYRPAHTEQGRPPYTVVVLHGDDGFRNVYLEYAESFAQRGLVAIAGCVFGGRPAGLSLQDEPIAAPEALPYAERERWPQAIDALLQRAAALPGQPAGRVFIIGNSGGGAMAVEAAVRHPQRVRAIVALSAPYDDAFPVPPCPLLMLQGGGGPYLDTVAAHAYEHRAQEQRSDVAAHYFEGRYHFVAFDEPTRSEIIRRSIEFFRTHASTSDSP